MTAVVALLHAGRIHLAGDSAGIAGWSLTIRADEKVYRNGQYVFGFTDSFRMGQLLRHAFAPPEPTGDLPKFMTTTFIDGVRTCLKEGGYATKESEQESGGNFIVGVNGRLFEIGSDYQVAEPVDGFAAVGCGFELALGALHATRSAGIRPRRRLEMALQAAEAFSAGVRGPFAFASTKKVAQ